MTHAFAKATAQFIEKELDIATLFGPGGAHYLSDLVERCFLLKVATLSKEQKAIIILTCLFSSLVPPFRFDHFLTNITSSKERTTFLSLLLHHLFGCNFPLHALISKPAFNSYLIQQLASFAKKATVAAMWNALSFTDKVITLGFCYTYYEEGSLFLAEIAREDPIFTAYCDHIDRGLLCRPALFEWVITHPTISKSQFTTFFAEQKQEIETKILQIKEVLQKKYNIEISADTLSTFISIFGLYGFQVPQGSSDALGKASLDQMLQMDEDIAQVFLRCFHAFVEHPNVYAAQMKKIVLAMPTTSRELKRLPWISSILSCLSLLMSCEQNPKTAIKDYPLFIFDQSEPKLFQKNSRYIARLNKKYQASIFHLDSRQLIALSKKLAVEKMVVTGPKDHFGYGGARNTVFLIAPVLHALFQTHGSMCITQTLSMPDKELHALFKEVVCSENALAIHMGEDDLWEPPATLISDVLFACSNEQDYFFRMGSCIGRNTAYVRGCFDAKSLLHGCRSLYSQFAWSEKQTLTGMRGVLTKPKICLNLPFGNEEAHLQTLKNTFFDFRRNAIHFSGWRYPKVILPTSHFAGVSSFLRSHNPYVFGLRLTEELLRPIDYKTTPLVWNRRQQPFSTLQEAIECMADDETIQAMQKQFWTNLEETTTKIVDDLLVPEIEKTRDHTVNNYLQELVQQANEYNDFVTSVLAEIKKSKTLSMATDQAKRHVENLYQKPIERMPFAHTLYLLCFMIGSGGFQEALALSTLTHEKLV